MIIFTIIIIPPKIIIICLQISRLVLVEKVTVSLEHDRVLRQTGQLYNFDQATPHIGRRGKFYIVYLHLTNSTPHNVQKVNVIFTHPPTNVLVFQQQKQRGRKLSTGYVYNIKAR